MTALAAWSEDLARRILASALAQRLAPAGLDPPAVTSHPRSPSASSPPRIRRRSMSELGGTSGGRSWRSWRKSFTSWLHTKKGLWKGRSRRSLEPVSASCGSLCHPPPCPHRALPPVPAPAETPPAVASPLDLRAPGTAYIPEEDDLVAVTSTEPSSGLEFSKSIERVKSCGWYWGPISGEAAERLLSEEPDGSFLVRDSSDDHYLFSLSFKLNDSIRHVRIEHDHGNFSFGTFTTFKSNTIVDFIENAVEHSRSGRYLFFLHRRPVLGPLRVQLLNPVSRFKQVPSLQHQCRFVILELVPRDLLSSLHLPKSLKDFLNTPFYYSELIANEVKLQSLSLIREENNEH
eukprot:maker-scaffold1031_size68893-snap-gene-0.25 protein:Tk04004 transcript:maker-scaffold1031_size68893-snap-gene-0.25-mRNA-1 annotation:"suppressor of cytokine signaling 7"